MGECVVSPILMLVPDRSGLFTTTVVISGITIVLGVLLLLILVFQLFGAIMPKIDSASKARVARRAEKKALKKAKKEAQKAEAVSQIKSTDKPAMPTPPMQAPPVAAPEAPVVEQGISQEVVAAIAAAVAIQDSGAVVRSVKRLNVVNVGGRNPWANAANVDNTRPF